MLSIFCPWRGRLHLVNDFVNHYALQYPNARIYMLEQSDTTLFKRGQLMNVAFNNLTKLNEPLDNILFIDLDIRLVSKINFEHLLATHKTVTIPYNTLLLYNYDKTGAYVPAKKKSYFLDTPDGGVTLFTVDMFKKCNGFSNLYIGWGREDSDFVRRNAVTRLAGSLIHLEHERNQEWLKKEFEINNDNFVSHCDFTLDGFAQTTADFTIKKIQSNIYHCKIKNISVSDNYIYKNKLLQEKL